jgi:alanyl-tRNA synthetase
MVRQIWRDLGVREEHILPGNAKDNFWGQSFLPASVIAF